MSGNGRSSNRPLSRSESSLMPQQTAVPAAACIWCASGIALLLDPRSETLYYDDEELDAYAGRAADAYTPDEIQAFEEVFFTLLPEDVQGWLISLQRRGIQLPEALEPAVWLVVREQREQKSAAKKKDQE